MSIAKQLGKTLGGKWTYDGHVAWHCDDNVRSVVRTSAGVDEFDNPLGPAQYWLYGAGQPHRAEAFMYKTTEWQRKCHEEVIEDAYRDHTS